MKRLTNQQIIEAYHSAKKLKLDTRFIHLLEVELEERSLLTNGCDLQISS